MNNKYQSNPFDEFKIPVSKEDKPKEDQKKNNIEDINEEELPKLKSINIKLPPVVHKEFKKHCIEKGISIQDHIFSLIKKELKKNK